MQHGAILFQIDNEKGIFDVFEKAKVKIRMLSDKLLSLVSGGGERHREHYDKPSAHRRRKVEPERKQRKRY